MKTETAAAPVGSGQKVIRHTEASIEPVVGCKLLAADGGSLNANYGRAFYPKDQWLEIPGNGAYVAVTGGLDTGGIGPMLAYLECSDPTGAKAPSGVVCYRRVRRIAACPTRITPELRGEVACYAPDLTPEQRMGLAHASTPGLRGWIACYAPDLTPEQRMGLRRQR